MQKQPVLAAHHQLSGQVNGNVVIVTTINKGARSQPLCEVECTVHGCYCLITGEYHNVAWSHLEEPIITESDSRRHLTFSTLSRAFSCNMAQFLLYIGMLEAKKQVGCHSNTSATLTSLCQLQHFYQSFQKKEEIKHYFLNNFSICYLSTRKFSLFV